MIDSRKIDDLIPEMQVLCRKFIDLCKAEGISILITSTYRDAECQNALYAKGRSAPGKIVTWAKGGQSMHNYRVAFDVVPMRYGKPVWSTRGHDLELWNRIGEIGKSIGLCWAGDWSPGKREFPHFQFTNEPINVVRNKYVQTEVV